MSKRDWKLLAAMFTIVVFINGFFELIYQPHVFLIDGAPVYPLWAKFLKWLMTGAVPIIYIWLDWSNLFPPKENEKDDDPVKENHQNQDISKTIPS